MSSRNGRQKNGSRAESEVNQAAKWITEFFEEFFSSAEYRHNLKRRILAGDANHMEILGHYYAFGNPRKKAVVEPPQPPNRTKERMSVLTKDERLKWYELARQGRAMQEEADRRLQSRQSGSQINMS